MIYLRSVLALRSLFRRPAPHRAVECGIDGCLTCDRERSHFDEPERKTT